MKIKTTMQLTPQAKQMLKKHSASIGLSATAFVEKLIREYDEKIKREEGK